jgi:hypothetical protein
VVIALWKGVFDSENAPTFDVALRKNKLYHKKVVFGIMLKTNNTEELITVMNVNLI